MKRESTSERKVQRLNRINSDLPKSGRRYPKNAWCLTEVPVHVRVRVHVHVRASASASVRVRVRNRANLTVSANASCNVNVPVHARVLSYDEYSRCRRYEAVDLVLDLLRIVDGPCICFLRQVQP